MNWRAKNYCPGSRKKRRRIRSGQYRLGHAYTEPLLSGPSATEWEVRFCLLDDGNQRAGSGGPNKFGPGVLDQSRGIRRTGCGDSGCTQQYGTPLNIGLVEDVDAAIEQYRKALLLTRGN